MNPRRFTASVSVLPIERIAYLAGDCCAAGFQSALYLVGVISV